MRVELYQVAIELDNGLVLKNWDFDHKRYDVFLKDGKKLANKRIVDITREELVLIMRTNPRKIRIEDIETIKKTDEV